MWIVVKNIYMTYWDKTELLRLVFHETHVVSKECCSDSYTGDTKKNGNFWKTQQKLKKSKKKNLLTEIEPLQLVF